MCECCFTIIIIIINALGKFPAVFVRKSFINNHLRMQSCNFTAELGKVANEDDFFLTAFAGHVTFE